MKSTISPRNVINPISRGLFTAAKNSVSRVKETTEKITKATDKNQKFAMNFVEFFGSKKNAKILKKSLKSIKESLVSTLEIAKALRSSLSDLSKSKKGRKGLFTGGGLYSGGLGGLVGGGLTLLFGKAALITLGILATGGLAALLIANKDAVFNFLESNLMRLKSLIAPLIDSALKKAFQPEQLQNEDKLAFAQVNKEFQRLKNEGGFKKEVTDDQIFNTAIANVIEMLKDRQKGFDSDSSDFKSLQRQIDTLQGKDNLGVLDEKGNVKAFTAMIGRRLTSSNAFQNSPAGYVNYSNNKKISLIEKEVNDNNGNLILMRSRISDLLDGKFEKPSANEKAFAVDLLAYIDAIRSGDKKNLENFSPPSSTTSNTPELNTLVEQFKSSKLLQGSIENEPFIDAKTLDADKIDFEKLLRFGMSERDQRMIREGINDIERGRPRNFVDGQELSNSNIGSGNGSGLQAFIPTSHGDGVNINAAFNYQIPIG